MSATGYPAFDTTIEKTNQVLREIEEAYGWGREERHRSYGALRAVLHTLRDRLPVNESADLAAQLPMLMRGLYFEGWKPARVPVKMDRDEFLLRIVDACDIDEGGGELLVERVLHAVRTYVTPGEWDDITSNLPRDLLTLLPA
jgi:uncharacterized protein (DUF2267 family)